MSNLTDVSVDSLQIGSFNVPYPTAATMIDTGAATLKCGVITLNKAGAIAVTLAVPVATTDDFKVLVIASLTAQAHTVALSAGTFGTGGAGYTTVTFVGAIGDSLTLMAYQGVWYVLCLNNATIA
jgi:uncharacterized protein YunC (DUF1805 family)